MATLKFCRRVAQAGFTVIEVSIVVAITVVLIAIAVKSFSFSQVSAIAQADEAYETAKALANNWKRLTQAAGVSYSLGGVYYTTSNPLLACAASSCASSGSNNLDAQRAIRILAEGPSQLNAAYTAAWTNSRLVPNTTLRKVGASYLATSKGLMVEMWGNGANGAYSWAMGPIVIYYCDMPDATTKELARKYAGVSITSDTQILATGPVMFYSLNSCGTVAGSRPVALVFS